MTGLAKAYLEFLEPTTNGPGGKTAVNGVDRLEFAFNPKEYTVSKSAEWVRSPVKNSATVAMPEFVGPGPRSLTVEMFLDAGYDSKVPVATAVETLLACCVPLPSAVDKLKPLPPFVAFGWGDQRYVACVKQVSAKYMMFQPDGAPVRAACQLTLEEIPTPAAKQNPSSGAASATRSHTVVAGDSLASIAHATYGDPNRWRDLAEANGIDDPLRLRPGTPLLLPGG